MSSLGPRLEGMYRQRVDGDNVLEGKYGQFFNNGTQRLLQSEANEVWHNNTTPSTAFRES